MKFVELVIERDKLRPLLDAFGYRKDPLPMAKARAPPQADLPLRTMNDRARARAEGGRAPEARPRTARCAAWPPKAASLPRLTLGTGSVILDLRAR